MNTHRHIKTIDGVNHLLDISWEYNQADESMHLLSFGFHELDDQGLIGPNLNVNDIESLTADEVSMIYEILVQDGLITHLENDTL